MSDKEYICSPTEEARKEGLVRKVVFSEAGKVIGIVSITVSVVLFIVVPTYDLTRDLALVKQRIETIEGNHLAHIQKSIEDINKRDEAREERISGMQSQINEIDKKMERVLTILENDR